MRLKKILTKILNPDNEIVLLVGPPGAGKSTLIKEKIESGEWKDYVIASTDQFVEEHAKKENKFYHEVWAAYYPKAEKKFYALLRDAVKKNKNIVVDRTNMSQEDRNEILKKIPENYKVKALVFSIPKDELFARVKNRHAETGKYISVETVQRMLDKFQQPTSEECDEIIQL